jgi:predicted secreted Zn-dependent protease
MTRRQLLQWLATMTVVAGIVISAVLEGSERTKVYEVAGSSIAQLRESLNRQRPVGPDGLPHDAITMWHIRWRYATGGPRLGCAVTSFEVFLETVTTMPKWVDEAEAPSSVVERWRTYYAALLVHEEGHKAIATAAAAAIRRAGAAVSPESSCAELARVIDEAATRVLDEYRQKERRYDAETSHGRTQGARFP